MFGRVCSFVLLAAITAAMAEVKTKAKCEVKDVKNLLKGCTEMTGLKVISTGGTAVDDSNCDVVVPKEAFAEEPALLFDKAIPDKFYTIIMVDPDAPNHPEGQFYLHMIKSNVTGKALKLSENGKLDGDDYATYRKPTPPKGTGAHRYMWLVYEQRDGGGFKASAPESRAKFALAAWLRGKSLCGPVAAAQFRAKF